MAKIEPKKTRVALHLDNELVEFFQKDGPMWRTRINDALKEWWLEHGQ